MATYKNGFTGKRWPVSLDDSSTQNFVFFLLLWRWDQVRSFLPKSGLFGLSYWSHASYLIFEDKFGPSIVFWQKHLLSNCVDVQINDRRVTAHRFYLSRTFPRVLLVIPSESGCCPSLKRINVVDLLCRHSPLLPRPLWLLATEDICWQLLVLIFKSPIHDCLRSHSFKRGKILEITLLQIGHWIYFSLRSWIYILVLVANLKVFAFRADCIHQEGWYSADYPTCCNSLDALTRVCICGSFLFLGASHNGSLIDLQ